MTTRAQPRRRIRDGRAVYSAATATVGMFLWIGVALFAWYHGSDWGWYAFLIAQIHSAALWVDNRNQARHEGLL